MNLLYKSLFLEKISAYPCYIEYKTSKYSFEKPFRFADDRDIPTLVKSDNIKLIDCTSGLVISLNFDDILMFHIDYEDDKKKCEEELQKTIDKNKRLFSKFKFLSGIPMYNLFFRSDIEESKESRLKNMLLLDLAHVSGLDDYDRLVSNDESIIQDLRNGWHTFIVNKYHEITGSLDEEAKSANDESIVAELQSIKEILGCIPKEAESELLTKKSIKEIMDYWPTLLLPKVDFSLDVFNEVTLDFNFKLKPVNDSQSHE